VRDTGVGIEPDRQAEIFSPFLQADTSTTRIYGGTGLGLTISSRLVEMMNGRIWVESEPGKGSTFHFTAEFGLQADAHSESPAIPNPPRASVRSEATAGRSQPTFDRPLNILLVEDNPVNSRLARHALEKAGYTVVAADNGPAALAALEHTRFDLVLMDVQMPGMDGINTTVRIREREKDTGDRVPVVALTAYAMPGDRARCLGAGMDEVLTKPIRPKALLEAIKRLNLGSERHSGSRPGEKIVLDRSALMERVAGDAQLLAEISGTFPESCGERLARAREALETKDAEKFACEVHTLRGMFRNLSGIAAEREAQNLEQLDMSTDHEEARMILATLEREVQALANELSAFARDALADRENACAAGKKNPGGRRGRLNAQREGGAREFRAE
jgi:CheY-like chemotaxis protein/HPt (histidine-containing phosphotransfer) domain-containing protein